MAKDLLSQKNACAYIRVSTDKQEELSPDAQKRLLIEYAKKNNMSLIADDIFMDNGISGRKAEKRPEFQHMIAMAKSKEHPFDVILVWKFSRFARNQEESIVYKSLLKKNNVEVVSVSEPLIDGPFGSLIERIIEWMDEYYSIRLSGEVIRGMTEKVLRGGYVNAPPVGYSIDKSTGIPMIDEVDAAVPLLVYKEFLDGKSFFEIAKLLTSLGYKTKKRNRNYDYKSVRYILENPFYIGKIRWNMERRSDHKRNDKSEWIISEGKHEPLIDTDTYDEVQRQIALRTRKLKSRAPSSGMRSWLGGIIRCSTCGHNLCTVDRGERFQCARYTKGACLVSHSIATAKLEQAMYDALEGVLSGSAKLNFEVKGKRIDTVDERTLLLTSLSKIDEKESRIKQAYRDGIDSLEEYKENKELLLKERAEITAALEKVKAPQDKSEELLNNISSVLEIVRNDKLDNLTRSNAIRSVVDHCVYDKANDSLEVYFFVME